jgi:hypothetical protein
MTLLRQPLQQRAGNPTIHELIGVTQLLRTDRFQMRLIPEQHRRLQQSLAALHIAVALSLLPGAKAAITHRPAVTAMGRAVIQAPSQFIDALELHQQIHMDPPHRLFRLQANLHEH